MVSTVYVNCTPPIFVEDKEITARKGGYVELICYTSMEAQNCTFTSPEGQDYNMYFSHDFNRIKQKSRKDCAVFISPVQPSDNGVWSCYVPSIDRNGILTELIEKIKLIVVNAPVEVSMKIDNKPITGL